MKDYTTKLSTGQTSTQGSSLTNTKTKQKAVYGGGDDF